MALILFILFFLSYLSFFPPHLSIFPSHNSVFPLKKWRLIVLTTLKLHLYCMSTAFALTTKPVVEVLQRMLLLTDLLRVALPPKSEVVNSE